MVLGYFILEKTWKNNYTGQSTHTWITSMKKVASSRSELPDTRKFSGLEGNVFCIHYKTQRLSWENPASRCGSRDPGTRLHVAVDNPPSMKVSNSLKHLSASWQVFWKGFGIATKELPVKRNYHGLSRDEIRTWRRSARQIRPAHHPAGSKASRHLLQDNEILPQKYWTNRAECWLFLILLAGNYRIYMNL